MLYNFVIVKFVIKKSVVYYVEKIDANINKNMHAEINFLRKKQGAKLVFVFSCKEDKNQKYQNLVSKNDIVVKFSLLR